ncbi:MAG: N-6 DNA methylase, partial [Thermoplasmata archaeon]
MPRTGRHTIEVPDELVRSQAAIVSDRISRAAATSISEEDLRIEVERALSDFSNALGISLQGHHEYSVGKGRADSVYDYVVIEYKKPSRSFEFSGSPAVREVSNQLKQRFKDFESEEHRRISSLYGIGCNGHKFVFIRYRNDKWEESAPVEVTPQSTARFLRALLSLGARGKPFLPERLASDFAFDGGVAGPGVKALHDSLVASKHPKVEVLFDEWKILFGEVCGYDVAKSSPKIEKLATQYGLGANAAPAALMFSLHTYYAIFVKLLAAEIVGTSGADRHSVLQSMTDAATPESLLGQLTDLESGGVFRQVGVTNFLEGDLFAWYLSAWDGQIEATIRAMVRRLDEYDPLTLSVEPEESRDLLKRLYQDLFPKEVRHDLGEYYTPDWLADVVLSEAGYDGSLNKRLVDPACGSGTFLVAALNRIRNNAMEAGKENDSATVLASVLGNLAGFDLNPIAVMTARANMLIALRDLFPKAGIVGEIPVYLCDSVLTPFGYSGDLFVDAGKIAQLPTSVGRFRIPVEIARERETLAEYTEILEAAVRDGYSDDEFLRRLTAEGLPATQEEAHRDLIGKLRDLDKSWKNGVWARIIKNSFAPVFTAKADFVVGNPPWIRWTYLPP